MRFSAWCSLCGSGASSRPSSCGASGLAGVVVEQLGWEAFIDRYDRPGMLFYLDPPYHGTEHVYGKGAFERADFARMAERLARLKGRFILSINDHSDSRETFAAFDIDVVETTYTVSKGAAAKAGELIISGGFERHSNGSETHAI